MRVARLNQDAERELCASLRAGTNSRLLCLRKCCNLKLSWQMQTIKYQQALLSFWTAKAELEKALGQTSERGMVNFLNRFKTWMVGGTLFPLALAMACQSKQVQKPAVR